MDCQGVVERQRAGVRKRERELLVDSAKEKGLSSKNGAIRGLIEVVTLVLYQHLQLMSQATPFHWSYRFSDGSRLVGQVTGELDQRTSRLLCPTQIQAEYFDGDGKTVLGSWENSDFVCFDLSADGGEMVIVASNDCFVANSMCLVCCGTRSRAQVTDWGSQLIAEPFVASAWSLNPVSAPASSYNWLLPPLFPSVSFTWRLPYSQTTYQWTFSPFLPFAPVLRVGQMAVS